MGGGWTVVARLCVQCMPLKRTKPLASRSPLSTPRGPRVRQLIASPCVACSPLRGILAGPAPLVNVAFIDDLARAIHSQPGLQGQEWQTHSLSSHLGSSSHCLLSPPFRQKGWECQVDNPSRHIHHDFGSLNMFAAQLLSWRISVEAATEIGVISALI